MNETEITGNANLEFIPDTPPWPKEEPKPKDAEPQFGPAKELLDLILANPDPETQGLSVILKRIPGEFGVTRFYPTTGPGGNAPAGDSDDIDQAVSELVALGWLKLRGSDGARKVVFDEVCALTQSGNDANRSRPLRLLGSLH